MNFMIEKEKNTPAYRRKTNDKKPIRKNISRLRDVSKVKEVMLLMCVYVCVYASNSVNQEQCEKYQELFIPYNRINHLQKDYFVSGFSYLHICTPQLILIR